MSKTIQLNAESISKALESTKCTSLTGLWKALGGSGSVSGSASKRMREAVPGVEAILAENKANAGSVKSERPVVSPKAKRSPKADKKPAKASKKSAIPRHPKNPFREGSGYGLLVDIIADAGADGIGKETLLKKYCRLKNKSEKLARYDLAVINSGVAGGTRHRSMRDGVTVIKDMDNFRIRFD